jgi:hypothetical protein
MGFSYDVDNAGERQRLHDMADGLSDDDLRRRLDNGLTVAAVLVHLAFWDEYCTALLKQWEQSGFAASRSNYGAFNAAIGHLASTIAPRAALELAVAAADAADRQVEAIAPDLAAAIIEGGSERMLTRAAHRRQHLDQIEGIVRSA